MTVNEMNLWLLAEELAEAAQRASKMARFGRNEVQPGQKLVNHERLRLELLDVLVRIRRLERAHQIEPITKHQVTLWEKQTMGKIAKMLQLSRAQGCLDP